MIFWVLEDIQAPPDSSRPAGSIGDVKFNIGIDYTRQKPLKVSTFYTFQVDNLIPAATVTRSEECLTVVCIFEVYRDAIIQSERAQGLLHMIQSLSQDLSVTCNLDD